MLSRSNASRLAAGNLAASRRAQRSAMRLTFPRAFASSTNVRPTEVRNGIVVWAITSRTLQPSHNVGASHCSGRRAASRSACSPRSATTATRRSSSVITRLRSLSAHLGRAAVGMGTSAEPESHRPPPYQRRRYIPAKVGDLDRRRPEAGAVQDRTDQLLLPDARLWLRG